jgi:RHS repeat-associated protein
MMTSWNKTLGIPTQMFNGVPSGTNITQTFRVAADGTFSVSDNAGNSYSLKPPGGLPTGILSVSLRGNTTTAVQTFLVKAGPTVLASITVTYSVNVQSCYPTGLKVDIKGSVGWPSHRGTILIPFKRIPKAFVQSPPVRGNSSGTTPPMRVYFGNSSGILLGFDWSDSEALHPSYVGALNAISYQVNSTFDIDPETVGTTTSQWALRSDYSGQVCYASGRTWIYYFNGTSFGWRSTTNTTAGWSSWFPISTAGTVGEGNIGYACAGTTVAYASGLDGQNTVYYRQGTMNANGTISWKPEGSFTTHYAIYTHSPTTAFDTSGHPWVAVETNPGDFHLEVWEATSTWTNTLDSSGMGNGYLSMRLVQLGGGEMALVGSQDGGSSELPFFDFWSGSAWLGMHWGPTHGLFYEGSCVPFTSATSSGAACVIPYNGSVYYYGIGYGVTSWPSGVKLGTGDFASISSSWPTKTSGGLAGSTLFVPYASQSTGVVSYRASTDGGASWIPALNISATESSPFLMASGDSISPEGFGTAAWVTGTSGPYGVRVFQVPVIVPQAATAAVSWARPGISPYESYFSSLMDYVSPGNGLLSVVQGAFDLPGRGFDVPVTLVYTEPGAIHSGSAWATDNFTLSNLGLGWSLDLPWLGSYYIHLPGGQAIPYEWVSTKNEYHGAVDFSLSTGGGASCPCTLTIPNGIQYSFNSLKQLTSESDSNGNTATFSYGSNGYLSSISTAVSTATFGYNSKNQLTTISSSGRTWTLTYAGLNLLTVGDPLSRLTWYNYFTGYGPWLISAILYPTGGNTTYSYKGARVGTEVNAYYVTGRTIHSAHDVLIRTDSMRPELVNGLMVWYNVTESDGVSIQGYVDYHFNGGPSVYEDIYSKDSTGAVISMTRNNFDSDGRLVSTDLNSPSGTLLAFTSESYDNWGNVIHSAMTFGASDTQQQTWLSYANTNSSNSFGSSGCTTSFYSNSVSSTIHNALVGVCNFQNGPESAQQSTYYLYDSKANLIEQKVSHNGGWLHTDYTYDPYGNVFSVRDPSGHLVYYRFSSAYSYAYLTKQTELVGTQNVTTTYTYDAAKGYLLSATSPDDQASANPTSYAYDALGRVLTVTYPAVNGVRATSKYNYYDSANTVTVTDEDGHQTTTHYDAFGRALTVQRMNGSAVYSTTSYSYNWLGQVASESIQQGPSTFATYYYTYDSFGRLVKTTNPDNTVQTASYNLVDNSVTATDENGHSTVSIYDWNGQLTSVVEHPNATATYVSNYTYDRSGNLLSTTDNNRQVTSYQYDDLNRLAITTYPDGTTQKLTYDNLGNVLTRKTQNGTTISYTYDSASRLMKTSYPGGSTVNYTYDQDGNVLTIVNPSATDTYTYDARDRLTSAATKIGATTYVVSYTLDKAGLLTTLKYPDNYQLSLTYDGVGRLKKVGTFATLNYTLDDQLSALKFGDGEVQKYVYNSMDRPTSIADSKGSTNYLSLSYSYDNAGNILKVGSDSYSYDWLDRVTTATGGWGTTTYRFDGDGNTLSTTTGGLKNAYTYKAYTNKIVSNNELASTSSPAVSYTYDGDGNTVTKSGGWKYFYNAEDEMTKAVHNGVTVQTNLYDGAGNRVQQVAGSTFTYAYQGTGLLYQKNVTGSTTTVTKWFYAGGMQVAKMVGAKTFYYHEDQVGSTRVVTSSTSQKVFSSDYTPFGTTSGASGSETLMYTDKPYDKATGLYYSGARFYDPTIGRFTSKDPMGSPNPPRQNEFSYANDNPLSYTDPSGTSTYFRINWGAVWDWLRGGLQTAWNDYQTIKAETYDRCEANVVCSIGFNVGLLLLSKGGSGDWINLDDSNLITKGDLLAQLRAIPETEGRTAIAQTLLAKNVGGTEEVTIRSSVGLGNRRYDVAAGLNKVFELKFGDDPITEVELNKDLAHMELGGEFVSGHAVDYVDLEYHFVQDPITGFHVNPDSLSLLDALEIPYKVWTPWEFWGQPTMFTFFGPGLGE